MKLFLPIIDNGMQLVQSDYAYSLAMAVSALCQKHEVTVARVSFPYPDGAMNLATAMFLESGCDRMLVIDGDLSFQPWHVELLLSHNLPIVAGLYPKKIAGVIEFPMMPLPNTEPLKDAADLVPVAFIARGFMAFKRDVFDVLIANKKAHVVEMEGRNIWAFWQTQLGGHSEDLTFCETWRSIGGSVYVDKRITVNHHGSAKFPL